MPEIGTYSLSGGRRPARERASSDPTGTAQPACLYASATQRRRHHSAMNLRERQNHRVSSHYLGWTATRCSAAGELCSLTSPFIERDSLRRDFQGAKADDRLGSGRSLVVLLCFGWSRPSHFGTKTADDTGSDEADLWKDTAKSHRTGDRNTFPLGKPAAH